MNPTFAFLIPLAASIAGGVIVLLAQSIDRNRKFKNETVNSLREIYSFSRKLEALMKNNFRELAMAKVHVEYWWYCHITSHNEDKGRYYEEHLRSQALAREIERKLGETKADFIGHVRKFQAIVEIKAEIENELLVISDLTNAKAEVYSIDLPHDKVRYNKAEQDESTLRDKYYENLKYFKNINDYLLSQLLNFQKKQKLF